MYAIFFEYLHALNCRDVVRLDLEDIIGLMVGKVQFTVIPSYKHLKPVSC